tara:strand:- start:1076 stop:1234 length:159 start_codon:yes stop_codon:yes gene_type:complete
MDPKKNIQKEVELALKTLHQKLDRLREQVDKLCETTDCVHQPAGEALKKDEE